MKQGHNADQDKALRTAIHALEVASALQHGPGTGKDTYNSGAIAPAASIVAPSVADFGAALPQPPSNIFVIDACVYLRHSAVDTPITVQVVEDPAGAATLSGPKQVVDSSHVAANASVAIPPFSRTVSGTTVKKYALLCTTGTGTVTVLAANEAFIRVVPGQQ